MSVYDEGKTAIDGEEELADQPCWIAVDMGLTTDLTAVVACWRDGEDGFQVRCWFFCPADNLQGRADRDGVPYPLWAEKGFIIPTPGNVTDYRVVEQHIRDLCGRFQVQEIAFDPAYAQAVMAPLTEDGLPTSTMRQGWVGNSASRNAARVQTFTDALSKLAAIAAAPATDRQRALAEYDAAMKVATGWEEALAAGLAYDEAVKRIRTAEETSRIPTPTQRPNLESEPDPYAQILKSGRERLDQLRNEGKLLGETGAAAAAMRMEQDMLNTAARQHIALSPEQRAEIRTTAEEFGRMTEAMGAARLEYDLQFRRDQAGRSDTDRQIATMLKAANQPVDLKSPIADTIRWTLEVERLTAAWEDVRGVGMDAIDKLVASAGNGFKDIGDVARGILGDILKEFNTLAIANPIKKSIYDETIEVAPITDLFFEENPA